MLSHDRLRLLADGKKDSKFNVVIFGGAMQTCR
jgi:hypothetical protein